MNTQLNIDVFSSLLTYSCRICKGEFEATENNLCGKCSEPSCDLCMFTCRGCEETYCQNCSWTCKDCQTIMCEDCYDFGTELCKFCKLEQEALA